MHCWKGIPAWNKIKDSGFTVIAAFVPDEALYKLKQIVE